MSPPLPLSQQDQRNKATCNPLGGHPYLEDVRLRHALQLLLLHLTLIGGHGLELLLLLLLVQPTASAVLILIGVPGVGGVGGVDRGEGGGGGAVS